MAKKSSFNLSEAVRQAIGKNPRGSAKDIISAIKQSHPGQKFKETTAGVTWSKLRREMGLIKGRKVKRVLKPKHRKASSNGLLGALDAAQALVRSAGGINQARELLTKLAEM